MLEKEIRLIVKNGYKLTKMVKTMVNKKEESVEEYIIRKILDKDYNITYEMAMLAANWFNIKYVWLRDVGGSQKLIQINVDDYDVILFIKDEE